MIDNIHVTEVQRIDVGAAYGPRRRITISFGDGSITYISLSTDGDQIPLFVQNKVGESYELVEEDET